MCAIRTRFDPKVVLFSCTKYSFYKPLFGPLRQQLVAAFASFDRKIVIEKLRKETRFACRVREVPSTRCWQRLERAPIAAAAAGGDEVPFRSN